MDGEITAAELERELEGDGLLVVDIRHPPEFEHGHLPGSVNIPLTELPTQIERVAGADHVVTVCPHGKASVRAARLIDSFGGFDGRVESLADGIEGWEGPLESGTDDTTDAGTAAADTDTTTADADTAESNVDSPDAPF